MDEGYLYHKEKTYSIFEQGTDIHGKRVLSIEHKGDNIPSLRQIIITNEHYLGGNVLITGVFNHRHQEVLTLKVEL